MFQSAFKFKIMKKKTSLILICLSAYCFLFYKQTIGINFLLFNSLLILSLLMIDRTLAKNRSWLIVAAGALLTSAGAFLYGNVLSFIGNIISLLLLSNLSLAKEASLFFAFIQSCFSYISIPFIRLAGLLDRALNGAENEGDAKRPDMTLSNFLKVAIPSIILVVFFFIYKHSNVVFSSFIDSLHIEIPWDFIGFSIWGFYLVYIFFNQYFYAPLIKTDRKMGNILKGENAHEQSVFSTLMTEFSAARLTFIMLNVLLLVVNLLDIKFILFDDKNIYDYSRYIHQGVNSSIFSVVVAILVTLYFFRGNLNFYSENKQLRIVALMWIAQNILLLLTCVHKNYSYIYEFGLTQKRIGVYVYLLITCIGLTLTWIKITRVKSNMYLVRANTWSVFIVLTLSTLVNWNRIILNHNITYKSSIEREYYLDNLPETSLPFLLEKWTELPVDRDKYPGDVEFEKKLNQRKKGFIARYESKQWQSWNLEDQRIYEAIQAQK